MTTIRSSWPHLATSIILGLLLFGNHVEPIWAQTATPATTPAATLESADAESSEIDALNLKIEQLLQSIEQKDQVVQLLEEKLKITGTELEDKNSTLANRVKALHAKRKLEVSELNRMLQKGDGEIKGNRQRIKEAIESITRLNEAIEQRTSQINLNLAATTEQAGKNADAFRRIEQRTSRIVLDLAATTEQAEKNADALNRHEKHLKDNSNRLFEMAIKMDEVAYESQQKKQKQQMQQEERQTLQTMDSRLLFMLVPCLLLPLGVLLYQSACSHAVSDNKKVSDSIKSDPALISVHSGGWVLAAWAGAGLGFYLLGSGIMLGDSQAGWIGMPTQFLIELFSVPLEKVQPALLSVLVPHTLLAACVGVLVCSVVNDRLPPFAHFFAGLFFGIIIYPLSGHWITTGLIAENQGWLVAAGFKPSGGAASVALLAGAAGLSLSHGLQRTKASLEQVGLVDSTGRIFGGTLLLWIAWYGIILAASPLSYSSAQLISGSFLVVAGTSMATLLFGSLFLGNPFSHQRFAGSALVGLIAVSAVYKSASAGSLLLFGLFAGSLYVAALQLLRRLKPDLPQDSELAGIMVVGGFLGTIGATLFGLDGFIFAPGLDRIWPQFLGLGAIVVLALAAGKFLALSMARWV